MKSKICILVGGSDLFSGLRGVSKGTDIICRSIRNDFDIVKPVNYNYFLDFGQAAKRLEHFIKAQGKQAALYLYGYSKGGELVLQLARSLHPCYQIPLLVTIDIANGPWSAAIDRQVPCNVQKNINVFQRNPVFPLGSYGLPAVSSTGVIIQNIDLTDAVLERQKVTHSNIELLMAERVIGWLRAGAEAT